MDLVSIKTLLKEAKEATQNKNFEQTIELCKTILNADRNNYLALVYLGAAMQETDHKQEAPKAFKKAVKLQPQLILAWQGLALYYEKYSPNSTNDSTPISDQVYQNLLRLERDTTKWCAYFNKFMDTTVKCGCINDFVECIEEQKKFGDLDKNAVMWPGVIFVLSSAKTLDDNCINLFTEALFITEKNEVNANKRLLEFLYNHRKLNNVIGFADSISDPRAKELACKMLGEITIEEPNLIRFVETDIVSWCDNLLAENTSNYSGVIGKAACLMKKSSYYEARDLLDSCLNQYSSSWHFQSMLCKAYLKLLCYYEAEVCAEAAKKCCKNSQFDSVIDSLLVEALAHSNNKEKWIRCIEICKKLLIEDRSNALALECMCRTYIKLQEWEIVKKLLTKLEEICSGDREVNAMLLRLQLAQLADKTIPPLEIMVAITVKHPNSPEAWYQLGMRCLQEDEVQQGITALFKAGKLAPYWYKVYLELGNYYMTHNDLETARCCYRKAVYLNIRCSEAAMALSDIYRTQGETQLLVDLLTAVTKSTQSKWAWLQLGMVHFEQQDINAAVKCLLAAIRIDVEDTNCWELLGDAYLARRAFTAAAKSYQKVVTLKPDALYPRLQIAHINLITEDAESVIPEFRQLAKAHPREVPVLKGLAEACLQTAKGFHSQRLLGLARDYLQEALDTIAVALKEWSEVSCLWKLLGDVFIRAGSLPPSWAFLDIPSWFDKQQNKNSTVQSRVSLFNFATLCYSQALKLFDKSGNSSVLWYDLAASYYLQSRENFESRDKKRQHMLKAFEAAKKSITLDPLSHASWNLLGVIASSSEINEKPLAQHSFIQSIINEEKNAVAWTNLGILYLELNHLHLANQALKSAQRIDENYIQSWIGQALIAESTGYSDTLDLLRHTTQLGFHPESGSGYAQFVLQAMQSNLEHQEYTDNIVTVHAVSVACDAMTWYTEERENDSCGFNMLGCLQEKSGLFSCATKSFMKALELAPKQYMNAIRANLGRVYMRMKNYKEALNILKEIAESDFQTQCIIGLAYFKADMYKEALEHFDTVLHYYCSEGEGNKKSDILIAKAAILYKSAKSKKDFHDAKTPLLECIVSKPTSVPGLFAAFAFGILKDDLVLSKTVLNELKPLQDRTEYIFHISTFQAYFQFIQGDLKGSVKSLEKSILRQPWQASLWFGLALLILEKICSTLESEERDSHVNQGLKQSAKAAAQCAYTSMQIGRNSMDVTKILPVVSVCHMLSGDLKRSLSVSQHAVHLFPNVAEGWATLVTAAMHPSNPGCPVNIASSLLSYVRKNLHLERALAKWMSNAERKLEIYAAN